VYGHRILPASHPLCANIDGPVEAASERPPVERESIHVDALIVGGGPAGLAAAIRLADLARNAGTPIEILLI